MSIVQGPWADPVRDPHRDRLPPQNLEAEQGLLGSVLRSPELFPKLKAVLRGPADFFRDAHQVVYQGMLELDAAGKPVDPITLLDHLAVKGRIVEVGGIDALTELLDYASEANAEYYAGIVREHAVKRELIEAASEVLRDGYANQCTAETLLDRAKRKLLRVEQEVEGTVWQNPDPCGGPPALPFPLDVLPEGLRRFVFEVSSSIPCPPDFVAVPCLAVAGAAMGRSFSLRVKGGWHEEGNLWTSVVGMPGTAKTPALQAVTKPLYRLMEELLDAHAHECEMIQLRKREREAQRKKLGSKADLPAEPEEQAPPLKRILVSDVTSESVGPRLRDNPRGLIMVGDELAGWVNGLDQYKSSGGNDKENYLALWSRQAITIDRKGQEGGIPIFVSKPFFAVTGGIQPDKLDMIGVGRDGRRRKDGFIDRILFAFPAPIPIRWRWESVTPETEGEWGDAVRRLWACPMVDSGFDAHLRPFRLDMTREAQERYAAWTDTICEETEESDFDEEMKGPYSKFRAYCARLALVLELVWWAFDPTGPARPECVGLRSVEGAIRLVDYFACHHSRVLSFTSGAQAQNPDAEAILQWLLNRKVPRFTLKEAKDNFRRRFAKNPDDLSAALSWLEQRGWIRRLNLPVRSVGRRGSDAYELNPKSLSPPESAR